MKEQCCLEKQTLKRGLQVIHAYYRFFMQMCAAVCLGAGSYMQNMAPKYPEGNLSDCLPWIMEGVFVWCLITVPAGCPPLCKAALWTHGTWPLCCGSCSRWIQCRSARESRLTLRGICRHNQNRVWQDILHHCSSMTITDIDCSWHTIIILYGAVHFLLANRSQMLTL